MCCVLIMFSDLESKEIFFYLVALGRMDIYSEYFAGSTKQSSGI